MSWFKSSHTRGRALGSTAILAGLAGLTALTWAVTIGSIEANRIDTSDRVAATVGNQARSFSEQIGRQILALDQTTRILADAWEADPNQFDLLSWRPQMLVASGISRNVLLVDRNGAIRQASIPEAAGHSAAAHSAVRSTIFSNLSRRGPDDNRLFIGPASIDSIQRLWHIDIARPIRNRDGSFAGAIVMDYRISALTDVFNQTNIGPDGLIALVGLTDGLVRAAVGPPTLDPEVSIRGSALFEALQQTPAGLWVGASATDSIRRIHGVQRIPGRDLAVVVALEERAAMYPARQWRMYALVFAGTITALMTLIAGGIVRAERQARRRDATMAEDQAVLAASNAQLLVARAQADAKAAQLEATLAGMTDGIAMVDAHMCLLEWNARFPEIAGIPPGILRIGLPMEDILRAQAETGQFGPVDVRAEVSRRMALLREGRFGVTARKRPDGRIMELRRNRLPDGGFVTLYSDITDRKLAEDALREAHEAAEAANAAKTRFVAIVSHEIRTPLNALLNTLRLLSDSNITPSQRALVDMASQSGDALFGLINDILEMSRLEAGQLTLRPSLFAVRLLLASALEMFQAQAAVRGISLRLDAANDVPAELFADPGRLRQVLLNLLSNAVKFASPGEVTVLARMVGLSEDGRPVLWLAVRDQGPAIPAQARDQLFRPFSRLPRPDGDDPVGTGLGLAICRHLIGMMGGEIGWEPWERTGGSQGAPETEAGAGNSFWIRLPLDAAPVLVPAAAAYGPGRDAASLLRAAASRHRLPRTRILLVEDIPANQVVTATMLRREGHMVDIAASGEQAIQAVSTKPYDIVFMDIFMPGMSGQEATQCIRALPAPARNLPILALTANVSPQDEAIFRAAGMDGFLGKPVSLPELLRALERHAWSADPGIEMPNAMQPTEYTKAAGLSQALAAERIAELRSNLPPATFASLVEECLVDLDHRMPALRHALASGAAGIIAAQAHAMVGMAAGYGMAALEAALRRIMDDARRGEHAVLGPDRAAEIESELTRGAAALRELLQKELV